MAKQAKFRAKMCSLGFYFMQLLGLPRAYSEEFQTIFQFIFTLNHLFIVKCQNLQQNRPNLFSFLYFFLGNWPLFCSFLFTNIQSETYTAMYACCKYSVVGKPLDIEVGGGGSVSFF